MHSPEVFVKLDENRNNKIEYENFKKVFKNHSSKQIRVYFDKYSMGKNYVSPDNKSWFTTNSKS